MWRVAQEEWQATTGPMCERVRASREQVRGTVEADYLCEGVRPVPPVQQTVEHEPWTVHDYEDCPPCDTTPEYLGRVGLVPCVTERVGKPVLQRGVEVQPVEAATDDPPRHLATTSGTSPTGSGAPCTHSSVTRTWQAPSGPGWTCCSPGPGRTVCRSRSHWTPARTGAVPRGVVGRGRAGAYTTVQTGDEQCAGPGPPQKKNATKKMVRGWECCV
jgi:hypothetical protein